MESSRHLVGALASWRRKKKPYKGSYREFLDYRLGSSQRINDPVDEEGNTLFHLAVIFNEHSEISLLRRLGGNLDKENRWGLSSRDLISFLGREAFFGLIQEKEGPKWDCRWLEETFQIKFLDRLEFDSYETIRWVLGKTREKMKREAVDLGNKWSMALFHKELRSMRRPGFSLQWVGPLVGHGIFASEDISALSYIGEYTGELRRRKLRSDQGNDFVFGYVIGPYSTPFVIDAQKKGNLMRFVNHSDNPNLTSRWMIFQGISHVILFANRFIPKGEQLTYDYGPNYWKKRSSPMEL